MFISFYRRNSPEIDRWKLACVCLIFCLGLIFYTIYSSFNYRTRFVPHVDLYNTHLLSDLEVNDIEATYTNLPLKYWIQVKRQNKPYRKNFTCAPLPNFFEIDLTHSLWQSVRLSNATIQLFNAYYDPRPVTQGTNIRLPCMIDRNKIYFTIHCQMWFEGETQPVIVKVQEIHYMWFDFWNMHADKQYGPYLIECKIPESHNSRVPTVVSIVENPCDSAKNLMRVHNIQTPEEGKKNFTVCVKGLDFLDVDLSARLVEWLELLFIMGVDKVHMYNLQSHPNIQKVLNYYKGIGKVDVRMLTLPEGEINFPTLQHLFIKSHLGQQCLDEIIPYNDCFYRNINLYKYVVLLDIDEIIIPQKDYSWDGLMTRLLNKTESKFTSYCARNVYFLDDLMPEGTYPDIPPYMHMLQHVYRPVNFTPPSAYVKSFFDTEYVVACHNHYPILTSPPHIPLYYEIDTEEAHMQHYRSTCAVEVDCNAYRSHIIKDVGIWKYKDTLIKNTNRILETLGFLV